ncbi:MAG: Hsp20/alpha crystallin family protein [Porticoccaceae bacterium]
MTDANKKQEVQEATKKQEVQKAAPPRALRPFEEIDSLFDQFLRRNWIRPWHLDWPALPELSLPELKAPKVDVLDREAEIVVKAEIPGVDKKDIDISVGEDSVTIKGETRKEEKEEKGDYYRCEISSGSFSRTIPLPTTVDGAKATASFKDGILELTLPKLKATKRHKISVK